MRYQSDAKGILAKHNCGTTAEGSSPPVKRGGNQLAYFLTERAFVTTEQTDLPSGFDHEILLLMPRVLKDGKGASVCLAAQDVALGTPHQLGHRHLCGSQYCMDGAMLEPFFRLAQQRHSLWWQTCGVEMYGEATEFYAMLDLVFGNTCVLHEAQTGLKISLTLALNPDATKELYNAFRGLGQATNCLFAALQLFIDRCVRWSDAEFDENACREFWLVVGGWPRHGG